MKSGIWAVLAAAALAVSAWAVEPVAEWTMWNSSNVVKNAGTGGEAGNLTLSEGVAFSDDVHVGNTGGTALRISGEDPTAAAETEASFDPLAGVEKFTIMAWVRRESEDASANQSARILADHDGSNGVEFRFGGAPGYLMLKVNGEEVWTTEGIIMPNNGTWRHVAVVYDSTRPATNAATRNVHFYIDGIQKGYGNSLDGIPGENSSAVAIGNASASRSSASQLVGSIDDVFVFADWAPEPSGNGNLNLAIRDWMLIDDSTRIPEDEPEPEPEPEEDWTVPPVMVGDVIAQKWGEERNYEELADGLIFVNAETGDLWYANEENPHGRAICVCKPFPDWHRFKDTVWFLGHVLQLNDHYSMQAEAHTLSIRYGGEAVWRILGDEGGDLAGILTVEIEDENHLLIQANATGTNVVLQVCTNLMEATPWKPAENAVIYTQTDAATTWRATLLDIDGFSGVELYRVLNGNNPRPAGVYCERPLRANRGIVVPDGQSISMGGVERYEWPDTSGIASNRLAIGAVATNLATHAARTDNPHGVTAAQIGALTAETDAAALEALGTHEADTNNPHAVTAEQAGAIPAWPAWYQFGTNGVVPDSYRESEGLFRVDGGTMLNVSNGLPLVVRNSGGPTPNDLAYLDLESANAHVQMQSGKGVKMYARQSGHGLTMTNSADNVFPVTWNGVTKNGWDDIVAWLLPATWGEDWEIAQTNGFAVHGGDWEPIGVYTNANGSKHAKFGYNADVVAIGYDAGTIDIGSNADTVSIGGSALKLDIGKGFNSTNFHIYKHPKFPDGLTSSNVVAGSVTAGSLTVGEGTCTNLAELASTGSVFAVSGRVSAIEGDYVKAADIADFATNGAVASLERRLETLERDTRIVLGTNDTVTAKDGLLWLDTSSLTNGQTMTLTLTDMDAASQTVVVRRIGDTGGADIVHGTNTYSLMYNGDGATFDWVKTTTNWYWRTF